MAQGEGGQKVSVNLQSTDIAALDNIAAAEGSQSKTEALRSALATLNFLEEEVARGTKIVLQNEGEPSRELRLPRRAPQAR